MAKEYGLTAYGFIIKRFETILQQIRNNLLTEFPDAAIGDDQIIGHLLDIYAKEPAEIWELAEAIYKSRAPSSADGAQLDDVGQINAIERGKARSTIVYESFSGINGTIIPLTFRFSRPDVSELFQPIIASILDNTKTSQIHVKIINVINLHAYIVIIDANSVQYVSDGTATIQEITAGVIGAINAQTGFLKVNAFEDDPDQGTFYIKSNDGESAHEIDLTADFTLQQFWTPIQCESENTGDIEAPAETLTEIITPVINLNEIINFADATIGSGVQTDQIYRIRLFEETRRLGGGSLEAIKDRILNEVDNVTLVKAFENDTIIIDGESRPPKSIEILVEGGADEDIANELWYVKSGGIETFGSESVIITDSQGDLHNIKFSRPVPQYVHFDITITVDATFPTNGVDIIKENIVLLGRQDFGIGALLLIQEFYCPIYDVQGITDVGLEWDVTDNPGDTPSFIDANIQLADRESPLFDISRIAIAVLP